MRAAVYKGLELSVARFYGLLTAIGGLVGLGLIAAWYMEHAGHWVTGMDNQIVWGMPHVVAVFLIVAASGALNVASLGSVFGREAYKPLARLSGLLAIALLIGGLSVLVLDLGRPDRLIVAMTTYNFKSIFAWNIFLYTGLIAVVLIYLWTLMERRAKAWSGIAGLTAFLWRLALTTGTGLIFGFLVAREAYDAAVLAPLFIAMSLAFGQAVFLLTLLAIYGTSERPLGTAFLRRMGRLLAIFVAAVFYFVVVQHLTNLYAAEHHGVERFILLEGGAITALFWIGQIGIGGLAPLALLLARPDSLNSRRIALAAALVILGGLAQVYVIIIGGQSYPLVLFPGAEVTSSFFDGQVYGYAPSLPEIVLGLGGCAIAAAVTLVALRAFRMLPANLSDEALGLAATPAKE